MRLTKHESYPDHKAERCDHDARAKKDLSGARRRQETGTGKSGDGGVGCKQPSDERAKHRAAQTLRVRTANGGDQQHLRSRLGPDPMDNADTKRRSRAVSIDPMDTGRTLAWMAAAPPGDGVPRALEAVTHQHPAATKCEWAIRARGMQRRPQHPCAKSHKRDANEPFHDGVDPFRED